MNYNNMHDKIDNNDSDNTNVMTLSAAECDDIRKECTNYENMRAAAIEALKIIQKSRGWVSDDAIVLIAKFLCISVADLEGVATFYNQIFRQPVGRHIIRYCDSVVCYLLGCEKIKEMLIDKLGVTEGNTTADNRFTLLPMCCVGACNKAPVIMINHDIHYCVVPKTIIALLEYYL